MAELANCSQCNAVFVKTIRDICQACYKEEEKAFDLVYRFLRVRKNREATMIEVVDATGVDEMLIIKFIKERRLLTTQFPKLAYPCERCGKNVISGKLCGDCSSKLLNEIESQEKFEQRKRDQSDEEKKRSAIYYTIDTNKK